MSAQIPDAFASAFNPVDFDPNAFDPAEAFNSMFELMDGMSNAIIIQVAMDEELAPFLKVTEELQPSFTEGAAVFHPCYLQVGEDQVPLLLVRSKIGLVNAASAVTEAISYSSNCLGVISAGTAGGLARGINVGDVLIGENYTYTDADATAFGYARGQVPGMPESYDGQADEWQDALEYALAALEPVREQAESPWEVRRGQMLAGNSFVTAHNVKDTREAFDGAISTDMETTAIAQVCHNYEIPFIGVRCVSDLCGPEADQDFHLSVDVVAPRSARYALQLAAELWTEAQLEALELAL